MRTLSNSTRARAYISKLAQIRQNSASKHASTAAIRARSSPQSADEGRPEAGGVVPPSRSQTFEGYGFAEPRVEADAWGRITSIGVGVGSSVMGIRFPYGMDHHHHRLGRSAGGWIRMEATPPVGAAMVRRSAQRSMPRGISRRLTPRVRSCARGLEPHTTPTLLLLWSAFITSDISLPNSLGTIRRAASIGLSGVYLRAV
jgi:hypothetical protein